MKNIHITRTIISMIVLLPLLGSCSPARGPAEEEQTVDAAGMYQGITPAASGPGIEMTVYLYPGNLAFRKMVYLKVPDQSYYDTGRWERTGDTISIVYDGSGGEDRFELDGNRLYLLDAEGGRLETDIPNIFLYKAAR